MTAYGLSFIQYGVFSIFLVMAVFQAYAAMYSKEERVFLRNRVVRSLKEKKGQTEKIEEESEVTKLFKEANWPWLTNIRFLIIRLSVLIVLAVYLSQTTSTSNLVLVISLYLIATEPILKYSVIRIGLSYKIKQIQHKREGELFTFFALLKTDLMATKTEQINVYHLLNETLSYFTLIQPVIRRFMSLWRKSPQLAGEVFEQELDGETAKFIGDFLSRLHELNREEALHLLNEQNELFAHQRSEKLLQTVEAQRNVYYTLFFLASFSGIAWFMWFMFTMVSSSLDF